MTEMDLIDYIEDTRRYAFRVANRLNKILSKLKQEKGIAD